MADNYLEEKYRKFLDRKDAEHQAKCRLWKKRLDAYRKKIEAGDSGVNPGNPDSPATGKSQAPSSR